MEVNRHEEIVEVVGNAIITYTVDMNRLKQGAKTGIYMDTQMLSLTCFYVDDELDGLYTEYHENGLQKLVGNYTRGKRNGMFVTYDEYGNEIERCEYMDNLRQGVCVSMKNGDETTSFYIDNMKQGEETVYYTNLDYLVVTCEYKDNKRNGLRTYYYKNGKKEKQYIYADDQKLGIATYWNQSGAITDTIEYAYDVRNGMWRTWYDNGNLKSETPYVDDVIQGERVTYWDDGSIKSRKLYNNNKKHGACKVYYRSGALMKSWTCVQDRKHGAFVHYHDKLNATSVDLRSHFVPSSHDNGKIAMRGSYENDTYQGKIYSYYNNGSIESIEKFLNGSKNGHQIYFNEDGSKSEEYILYRRKLHNIRTIYGDNGAYKLRTMYDNGKRVWEEEYRNNGSLYTYSEFVDDHRHGQVITYYDLDIDTKNVGIIWMKSIYKQGAHITTTAYYPDGRIKYKNVNSRHT